MNKFFTHSMRNAVLLRKSTEIWSLYNGFSWTNFSAFAFKISSLYDGFSYKSLAEFCAKFRVSLTCVWNLKSFGWFQLKEFFYILFKVSCFFDRCLIFQVFRMVSIKRVFFRKIVWNFKSLGWFQLKEFFNILCDISCFFDRCSW